MGNHVNGLIPWCDILWIEQTPFATNFLRALEPKISVSSKLQPLSNRLQIQFTSQVLENVVIALCCYTLNKELKLHKTHKIAQAWSGSRHASLKKDLCFARSSLTCFKVEKRTSQTFAYEVDACKAKRQVHSETIQPLVSFAVFYVQWHFRHVPLATLKVGTNYLTLLAPTSPTHLFLGPNFLHCLLHCQAMSNCYSNLERNRSTRLCCACRAMDAMALPIPAENVWHAFHLHCQNLPLSVLWYGHYPTSEYEICPVITK